MKHEAQPETTSEAVLREIISVRNDAVKALIDRIRRDNQCSAPCVDPLKCGCIVEFEGELSDAGATMGDEDFPNAK